MINKLVVVIALYCTVYRSVEGVGEKCSQDGFNGVCRRRSECASATQLDIIEFRMLSECENDDGAETVCCLEISITPANSLTRTSTTEHTSSPLSPSMESRCAALPPELTPGKTGRKAWDNCIEYQKQLVYPCGRSVALRGGYNRINNCKHSADTMIMGGRAASTEEFPHMVQLGFQVSDYVVWSCSGTLLSDWFILTAGHCTSMPMKIGVTKVSYAAIGSLHNQNRRTTIDNSHVYSILTKDILKHPEYKPPRKYHDIALLKTATRMNLSPSAVPACLDIFDGNKTNVVATGWGQTETQVSSYVLKKVTLSQFSDAECLKKYSQSRLGPVNTTIQMCYGHRTQVADTCPGDSGGPITIHNPRVNCMYSVVGITSNGKACGQPGMPGIYTKIAPYVTWIESVVWPESDEQDLEPR